MNPLSNNFVPDRVLIVKPSALGDIVHALPILNLLRRRWPRAHLSWLIAPAFSPLIAGHEAGCELIAFDRRGMGKSERAGAGLADALALAGQLADRRFDLVLDLQGLLRSGLFTWSTLAPVRIGFAYAREGAWLGYTHRVPARGVDRHAVERYLDIAEALGCGRAPVEHRFPVSAADRAHVDSLIPAALHPFAVLLPGTNWETKKWPIAHYAQLASMLRERLGLTPVIAGGGDVVPLAAQVSDAVNLANRTSLPQLVALLERAALVVANDSGPMHIAAALGRPLVTIFGPTNPIRTGPHARPETVIRLNIVCSPCYSRRCSHTSCMHWLTPERVFEQAASAARLAAFQAGMDETIS